MIFDMPTCGACRTCEMACSYHHRGIFNPSMSSIKIKDKEMGKGFSVEIVGIGDETRIACDGCDGRDGPLCLVFCEEKEELEKMIKEYMVSLEGREKVAQ